MNELQTGMESKYAGETPKAMREPEIRVELACVMETIHHLRESVAQIEERFEHVLRVDQPNENGPTAGEASRSTEIARQLQGFRHSILDSISRLDDLRDRCEL